MKTINHTPFTSSGKYTHFGFDFLKLNNSNISSSIDKVAVFSLKTLANLTILFHWIN